MPVPGFPTAACLAPFGQGKETRRRLIQNNRGGVFGSVYVHLGILDEASPYSSRRLSPPAALWKAFELGFGACRSALSSAIHIPNAMIKNPPPIAETPSHPAVLYMVTEAADPTAPPMKYDVM